MKKLTLAALALALLLPPVLHAHEGAEPATATAKAAAPAKAKAKAKKKAKAAAKPAAKARYVCPMHDGGESDHPGHCPKCGMDLVEEKA
jgi:Cu+-exporting ATPase